jgi:uncharacterized protein (DUF305 family)
MTRKTLVRTALTALTSVAVLGGCAGTGGDTTTPAPTTGPRAATGTATSAATTSGEHNRADITFARRMIPHHQQAVEMAELVEGRTNDPEVRDLAERITRAQGPEIRKLTAWLRAWNAPTPSSGHAMPGAEHGSGMSGMMSGEQLAQLRRAEDAAFDRQWLSMMITHHEGAVEMARVELSDGSNAEAKTLARGIIDSQQAEIDEMRALLRQG